MVNWGKVDPFALITLYHSIHIQTWEYNTAGDLSAPKAQKFGFGIA
jgi:hypothetical protein